jgi:hypothetical protein
MMMMLMLMLNYVDDLQAMYLPCYYRECIDPPKLPPCDSDQHFEYACPSS